jgi:hypothetical protein
MMVLMHAMQKATNDDDDDDEDEDEEESSSDADMPGDATVRLVTRKQASPDADLHNFTRNMPRRAKTFSPVDKKTADTQAVYRVSYFHGCIFLLASTLFQVLCRSRCISMWQVCVCVCS